MTQEPEKEFDKILELTRYLPDIFADYPKVETEVRQAMKAAHNAAVRKCAKTADWRRGNRADQIEVSKDSILKNIIP